MTEVTNFSEVTIQLLTRIDDLKKSIKNSMTVGEVNILKGILIFETILKEIDPLVLDRNEIDKIEEYTRKYLIKKEDDMQRVNAYVHYGVNRCFLILETFNNAKEKKLDKKSNLLFTFK